MAQRFETVLVPSGIRTDRIAGTKSEGSVVEGRSDRGASYGNPGASYGNPGASPNDRRESFENTAGKKEKILSGMRSRTGRRNRILHALRPQGIVQRCNIGNRFSNGRHYIQPPRSPLPSLRQQDQRPFELLSPMWRTYALSGSG